MKENKIPNPLLIPLFTLLFASSQIQSQELRTEIKNKTEIEKKAEISVEENVCSLKYVGIISEKDSTETLFEKFKEARKYNKENRKKAAKYYNPVIFIYRLIGL